MNGLLGKNISYTLSKWIHEQMQDTPYHIFDTEDYDAILEDSSITALNVTIPYKEKVLTYLDYLDSPSTKLRAVNTIIRKQGKLYGYNTDYYGFVATLAYYQTDLKDKRVLILGNGASSRMVELVATEHGAKEIMFLVRNKKQEKEFTLKEFKKVKDFDILINATPVGNIYNEEIPFGLDVSKYPSLETVIDLNYAPLYSKLLLAARSLKLKYYNGLFLLIAQAIKSRALLTPDADFSNVFNQIRYNLLQKVQNIVLIGMPYSGKSTIGSMLAKLLDKPFLDSDVFIAEQQQQSIAEIFDGIGEKGFRKIEKEAIELLSKNKGVILSVGGGAVLDEENRYHLSKNGFVVYLKRDHDMIEFEGHSRPLTHNLESFVKLEERRTPVYTAMCDIIVGNDASLERVAQKIKEYYNEILSH